MVQTDDVVLLYVTRSPELAVADTVAVPSRANEGAALNVIVCVCTFGLLPPQPDSKRAAEATRQITSQIPLCKAQGMCFRIGPLADECRQATGSKVCKNLCFMTSPFACWNAKYEDKTGYACPIG
jgi:hypothetical protein